MDLTKGDHDTFFRKLNPFCALTVSSDTHGSWGPRYTRVKPNTSKPTWDDSIEFPMPPEGESSHMKVICYTKESLGGAGGKLSANAHGASGLEDGSKEIGRAELNMQGEASQGIRVPLMRETDDDSNAPAGTLVMDITHVKGVVSEVLSENSAMPTSGSESHAALDEAPASQNGTLGAEKLQDESHSVQGDVPAVSDQLDAVSHGTTAAHSEAGSVEGEAAAVKEIPHTGKDGSCHTQNGTHDDTRSEAQVAQDKSQDAQNGTCHAEGGPEAAQELVDTAQVKPEATQELADATQGEPNAAQEEPKAMQGEAEAAQEEPEAAQEEPDTAQVEAIAAQEEANATQEGLGATQEESDTAQGEAIVMQEEASAMQEELEVAREEADSVQGEAIIAQEEANAAQEEPEDIQGQPEAAQEEPQAAQEEPQAVQEEASAAQAELPVAQGERAALGDPRYESTTMQNEQQNDLQAAQEEQRDEPQVAQEEPVASVPRDASRSPSSPPSHKHGDDVPSTVVADVVGIINPSAGDSPPLTGTPAATGASLASPTSRVNRRKGLVAGWIRWIVCKAPLLAVVGAVILSIVMLLPRNVRIVIRLPKKAERLAPFELPELDYQPIRVPFRIGVNRHKGSRTHHIRLEGNGSIVFALGPKPARDAKEDEGRRSKAIVWQSGPPVHPDFNPSEGCKGCVLEMDKKGQVVVTQKGKTLTLCSWFQALEDSSKLFVHRKMFSLKGR